MPRVDVQRPEELRVVATVLAERARERALRLRPKLLEEADPPGSTIVASDIVTAPHLTAGRARELFRRPDLEPCVAARCYDISPNGPRFLLRDQGPVPRASVTRMDLVVNWAATVANNR